MTGLYFHIPFCVKKCLYCDFYVEPACSGSIASRLQNFNKVSHNSFIEALKLELDRCPKDLCPELIYMGGGTPTELSDIDFRKICSWITHPVTEWTVESNPGTLTPEKIMTMKEAGVTRVSLGAQSFNLELLQFLGRVHEPNDIYTNMGQLRKNSFSLNMDLIFGIPGQDLRHIKEDLQCVLQLEPNHVSWYCLEYEPGSGMTTLLNKGFLQELDDQLVKDQYSCIRETLIEAGYEQYELFSFAQPGHQCSFNKNGWQGGAFIGIGPGAFSHWQGCRYSNPRNMALWQRQLLGGLPITREQETLLPEAKARELLMTSLRQTAGITASWFLEKTGFTIEELFTPDPTYFEWDQEVLRLKPSVYLMADLAFSDLF